MITSPDTMVILGGGIFFALLGLTRFALDLGFVQRPIFVASLWALVTWQAQPVLSIGIFFELLWLDLFPAGTFIPPHSIFSLLATLTLLTCLPASDMRMVTLILICTTPLGYLGAWTEQWYRRRQNLSYNSLITWTRNRKPAYSSPEILTKLALTETFVLNLLLFFLCVLPLFFVLRNIHPWVENELQPTWPMLWLIASLGALLSLRIHKAYILAAITMILGILLNL